MENSDDIRLIVKIAQLYYEQDMTRAQIARELGIYRTTISRLLKRGREQGIVTIAINYDYNENLWLEQQLKQKFALKEVVVAASDALQEEDQLNLIGQHGAQLVDRLLEPGDIVGFSRGRAVRALVENLPQAGQSRRYLRADYRRPLRQTGKPLPREYADLRRSGEAESGISSRRLSGTSR